ncbi:MAG: succinate dehydrogenase [Candidatus Limnocylindrales bacterium]|jgi:succinate dehydrogenase / fumarate reductase membrane anchor subunit
MALYSRSGRPKPQSGGFELAAWYFMRLSGVALFVLALIHFSLQHFLFDPSQETATWIFNQRWNSLFWRGFDWLLLMMVVLHAFLGMRTVTMDYLKGGTRTLALTALYLVGAVVFVMGTIVVMSVPLTLGK